MKAIYWASLAMAAVLLAGCNGGGDAASNTTGGTPQSTGGAKKLVIAWAQWDPAVQMAKLAKDYTKETGVEVEVQQIPWSDFETKIKNFWSSKGTDYDMIIGDSQWLGTAAEGGHYVDLTDWAKTAVTLDDIEPAALKSYGEYEGKLYAMPCMSDALGFAYRKDLFEDPKNKEAFKAKYGKELAVPETWDDLKNLAEFFTKPADKTYGLAMFYSKNYDGATMGFEPFLWGYGGDWNNVNTPEAKAGLDMYVSLKKFCPPGGDTFYFDESLKAFQQGQVAIAMNWFAFFPGLVDSTKNKFADKTGYFKLPQGPKGRFVSLGGQGISVSAYSANQEEAKKFVAWLQKEETQAAWAKLGGLTSNKKVGGTADFAKANPYNSVFTESAPFLKDFDNSPKYGELMSAAQTEINAAASGTKEPAKALEDLQKQMEEARKAS